MKHNNLNSVAKLPLQGLMVYALVFLLVISLSSFIQRINHSRAVTKEGRPLSEQFHSSKKHGNQDVGVASMALGLVVITISAGLALKSGRV